MYNLGEGIITNTIWLFIYFYQFYYLFIHDLTSLGNKTEVAFDDPGGGWTRRQARLTATSPSPPSAPPSLTAPHRTSARGPPPPPLATATDAATRTSAPGGRCRDGAGRRSVIGGLFVGFIIVFATTGLILTATSPTALPSPRSPPGRRVHYRRVVVVVFGVCDRVVAVFFFGTTNASSPASAATGPPPASCRPATTSWGSTTTTSHFH